MISGSENLPPKSVFTLIWEDGVTSPLTENKKKQRYFA